MVSISVNEGGTKMNEASGSMVKINISSWLIKSSDTSIRSSSTDSLFPYTESKMFFKLSLSQQKCVKTSTSRVLAKERNQHVIYFCFTRLKIAVAIPCCFSKKSTSQSRGNKSLILQSSTMALLFIPPAQFSNTRPRTKPLVESDC